ncbi:hypothetical protein [uncultured Bacteroides sp.]|uniref:hypothetical protein n=1 Tax=uncultured Bacteroides sp. TaxID=162156 RepID=UPI00260DC1C9|nr:hypothetical protein [uncultured Bacteroides sp.]
MGKRVFCIPLFVFVMASIEEVYKVVHQIAMGIESECEACLLDNGNIVEGLVREQLYAGQNGKGRLLNPTYENDPFFEEPGRWFHRSKQYKHWKAKITPPIESEVLFLPPRPLEVPNLFITGTFHNSIMARPVAGGLSVDTIGFKDGNDIKGKYGEDIFVLGDEGKEYFAKHILRPYLERFFENCGYR